MPNKSRAIIQCNRDGEDIQMFSSVQEAGLALGIGDTGHIYKSIKYGLVAHGYRWRWVDEPLVDISSYGMRLKKVVAYKDDRETIYPSIVAASNELGASVSHIQMAILTGGVAKGYRFRLLGDPVKPLARRSSRSRAIVSIDDDGHIMGEYGSAKEAALLLGVSGPAIYWCLSKSHADSKCKGYRLRYKDEYQG